MRTVGANLHPGRARRARTDFFGMRHPGWGQSQSLQAAVPLMRIQFRMKEFPKGESQTGANIPRALAATAVVLLALRADGLQVDLVIKYYETISH